MTLNVQPGFEGAVGPFVPAVDLNGVACQVVIPAFTQVDGSGVASGSAGSPVVVAPAPSSATEQFAGPTGGITDTASHAIFAAGAAGVRNYLTGLQYANTGAASEITILDGATVIWRGYAISTTGAQYDMVFNPPLKGTAATAMNVAMVTTASATRVSAQGYTGA